MSVGDATVGAVTYIYAHPVNAADVPAGALSSGDRVIFDRFCPIGRIYNTPEPLWDPDTQGFEGDAMEGT